jgi:hypothetical protein
MLTCLAFLFTSCHLWVGRTTNIDIQDMTSFRSGVLMRDFRQCYESLETFIRKERKKCNWKYMYLVWNKCRWLQRFCVETKYLRIVPWSWEPRRKHRTRSGRTGRNTMKAKGILSLLWCFEIRSQGREEHDASVAKVNTFERLGWFVREILRRTASLSEWINSEVVVTSQFNSWIGIS